MSHFVRGLDSDPDEGLIRCADRSESCRWPGKLPLFYPNSFQNPYLNLGNVIVSRVSIFETKCRLVIVNAFPF